MLLHVSETCMTSLLFFSIAFSGLINSKGIGFCIIIICSSAVMISGIESIANHTSYFDRGVYQFLNLSMLFTGISFVLDKSAGYYQLAVNLFFLAWVLQGQTSNNVIWCILLASLTTLTKNRYYMSYAYLGLSIVYFMIGLDLGHSDDKYAIVVIGSCGLMALTANSFVSNIKPEYEEIKAEV